jgi:16S rRNA (adenine1518-N6/adenine1519-N6)-dimethyltransferase
MTRPRAKKRFGQHFLEPAWVAKVLRAIEPRPGDVFVEIGPGPGALTRPLAASVSHVVGVEIDRELAERLPAAAANLTILCGDFLTLDATALRQAIARHGDGALRVAGNLPYNVASPILFRLTELYREGLPFVDATVMLQREVADRLVARPGTKEYGVLTIGIHRHAHVIRLLSLPPGAFRPAPKVHSAVVRLAFHPPDPPARDEAVVQAMTQAIFTRRRKTLANALLAYPPSARLPPREALAQVQLDGQRRPETLNAAEIVRLADAYADGA